jgi:hypothetical protein
MSRFLNLRALIVVAVVAAFAGAGAVIAQAVGGGPAKVVAVGAPQSAGAGSNDYSAYAKCLNEHGWPVGPDLSIDPNGEAPPPGVVDAAVTACQDKENGALEALRPSEEQLQALAAHSAHFASCMSDHGVDIGQPDVFRNRVGIGVTFPGYDPSAKGFDDAYAACKTIMNVFG